MTDAELCALLESRRIQYQTSGGFNAIRWGWPALSVTVLDTLLKHIGTRTNNTKDLVWFCDLRTAQDFEAIFNMWPDMAYRTKDMNDRPYAKVANIPLYIDSTLDKPVLVLAVLVDGRIHYHVSSWIGPRL